MGIPLRKSDKFYTYGDYRDWPDDERWELIDGVAYNMSPAANRRHQKISVNILAQLIPYVTDKPCEVYHAPFDVLLSDFPSQEDDDIPTVVQPDISVICDPEKLTVKGCTGAPDLVVEILSPYTAKKDYEVKHALYEKHGVREYWIVDPGNKFILVYRLGNDKRFPEDPEVYEREGTVPCSVLPGFELGLARIFSVADE